MYVHLTCDGETWAREAEGVPRSGDIIDRSDGRNYVVVSVHWVDRLITNPAPCSSPIHDLPITKLVPQLIVRELH